MKRLFFAALMLSLVVSAVPAQKTQEAEDRSKVRREMIKELAIERTAGNIDSVTVSEVGEVESFNKNARFLGVAQSGFATIYTTCDPAILLADLGLTLGPDDRCLAIPAGSSANATFEDMARITIPGRTVSNIIYMMNNHTINWEFLNDTAAASFASMSYAPRITFESVALNDPAAIDPVTGLPMNGKFSTTGNGSKFQSGTIAASSSTTFVDSYSRANTLGFSREYFRQIGLPESVINNIYRNPVTIRLGMRLSGRSIPFGQFIYTARFFGN